MRKTARLPPIWTALIFIALIGIGCRSGDERLVELSRESTERQAEQNRLVETNNRQVREATNRLVEADAKSRTENIELHRQIESERSAILRATSASPRSTRLAHPQSREALRILVARLGMRVGLKFDSALKGKVRKVRRLVGGLIAFGDRDLPVPLHRRDRLDPKGTQPAKSRRGDDSGELIEKVKKSSRREVSGSRPRWIGSHFC
jgi:hypothetical protein